MSFLYLQQNYRYSSICDPGMVSQLGKKKNIIMSEIRNDWFLVQQGLMVNKLSTSWFHLMSFLYLQQNYRYSSICDPGVVSQCAKKKLVPQKVA